MVGCNDTDILVDTGDTSGVAAGVLSTTVTRSVSGITVTSGAVAQRRSGRRRCQGCLRGIHRRLAKLVARSQFTFSVTALDRCESANLAAVGPISPEPAHAP